MPSRAMPDLQQEALRPVASPVDTFVQPSQNPGQLGQVLKALEGLSPVLGQMSATYAKNEREQQEASAEAKIGGMTFEQSQQFIKDGQLSQINSPWFRAAFEKSHGQRIGNEIRRAAETELSTADMSEVDVNDFVAKKIAEAAEGIDPQSKFMMAGFAASTRDLPGLVADKVNADRITRTVEARDENAYANFDSMLAKTIPEGFVAKDVAASLRTVMKMNRDMLGMSYQQQERLLQDLAKKYATVPGGKEVLEAIGSLDRGDGISVKTKMGAGWEALRITAENTDRVEQTKAFQPVLDKALADANKGQLDIPAWTATRDRVGYEVMSPELHNRLIQIDQSAKEGQLREAQQAAADTAKDRLIQQITPDVTYLAASGRSAEIEDITYTDPVSGKVVELKRDEIVKIGLEARAAEIERDGLAQGRTPRQIKADVVAMYGGNGMVPPVIENSIRALIDSYAPAGDVPAGAANYVDDLALLEESGPGALALIAKNDEDLVYLQMITTGIELNRSPEDAIRMASYRRDNAARIAKVPPKEMRAVAADVMSIWKDKHDGVGALGISFTGKDKPVNNYQLEPLITERVRFYYAQGVTDPEVIAKKVAETLDWTHAYHNGFLIDTRGTGQSAQKVKPVLEAASEAVKAANPGMKGKVTFVPVSPGSATFVAVNLSSGWIDGTQRTWAELQREYATAEKKRQADRAAAVQQKRAQDAATNDAMNRTSRGGGRLLNK